MMAMVRLGYGESLNAAQLRDRLPFAINPSDRTRPCQHPDHEW